MNQSNNTPLLNNSSSNMSQHNNTKKSDIPWYGLEITGSVRNLSPSIWNMTHITSLFLNQNCLTRIPPDIGKLVNLRHLDLSSNKLRCLPREIGDLILLEELLLNDNQIRTLPLEMGKLFHLKKLGLRGNPPLSQEIVQIYQEPNGTQKLIAYLLDHLSAQFPTPRPPQRPWILMDQPVDRTKPSCMFTTMCYNVLCDKYATRQLYGYCPPWALSWDYRKQSILEELKSYNADIIALQEIETEQYHDFFLRELQQEGYQGIFSPKSRAKTMSEGERKHVDGCAIFFKTTKFSLIQEHLVEFNQLAMANAEGSDDMLNRVMTKDNIALAALLEIKDGAFDLFQPNSAGGDASNSNSGQANITGSGSGVNIPMTSSSSTLGPSRQQGDNLVLGNVLDSGTGEESSSNSSPVSLGNRPLHQQRLLVCTAHIHWDPKFCDVKIIQTIMLMHELQAIANQAARDLLASHGNGDIESIKQYYLKGLKSEMDGQNHLGSSRPPSLSNNNSAHQPHPTNLNDQDELMSGGDTNSRSDQLGAELIPLILCVDSNSLPESSVVDFLSNRCISADHPDFKELAYKDCLRKICNSRSSALTNSQSNQGNQYSGQTIKSSMTIPSTLSPSSTSSSEDQQKSAMIDLTAITDGTGNQRPMKNGLNHNNSKSTTINYTHPFYLSTAYTGEGAMPFTNYTFDFKGVIDYIFYSKNLMSVLGVSGLDNTWIVENKVLGLPHPYFPSDHFPLHVELEILPSPRVVSTSRHKLLEHQQQQQNLQRMHSQQPSQHNRKNDFFQQTPMRKPFFGT